MSPTIPAQDDYLSALQYELEGAKRSRDNVRSKAINDEIKRVKEEIAAQATDTAGGEEQQAEIDQLRTALTDAEARIAELEKQLADSAPPTEQTGAEDQTAPPPATPAKSRGN